MITHNNEALYRELFDLAQERLNETFGMKNREEGPIVINDLETYFQHLRDLVYGPNNEAENDKDLLEQGYIFLKLPSVEEEAHFVIDANSRKIDTKKFNAVLSVQGDEIAEIVFFEIDRFFDATDLNQMDIAIQWSYMEKGASTPTTGYTPAFIKYIEPKEDKLIFGWPITSEVTAHAGALTFSVRFYKVDPLNPKELLYSFTTLNETMNIGSSLQVDVANTMPDDPVSTILSRLTNSSLEGVENVTMPWFVFDNTNTYGEIANITDPIQLYALATKTNGSLTYQWLYNGEPITGDWISAADQEFYVEVNEKIDEITTYYYYSGSKYHPVPAVSAEKFRELKAQYTNLYVNCIVYELNADNVQAGDYQVDCRNYYNADTAFASGKEQGSDLTKLPKWTVQGPAIIVIQDDSWPIELALGNALTPSIVSGVDASTKYKWTYKANENAVESAIADATVNSYIPTQEGYYKLEMKNIMNRVEEVTETPYCLILDDIADFTVEVINRDDNSMQAVLSRELGIGETVTYSWVEASTKNPLIPEEDGSVYIPQASFTTVIVTATITKGSALNMEKSSVSEPKTSKELV